MKQPVQAKLSLAFWWVVALTINIYLCIGVINTATVILQ